MWGCLVHTIFCLVPLCMAQRFVLSGNTITSAYTFPVASVTEVNNVTFSGNFAVVIPIGSMVNTTMPVWFTMCNCQLLGGATLYFEGPTSDPAANVLPVYINLEGLHINSSGFGFKGKYPANSRIVVANMYLRVNAKIVTFSRWGAGTGDGRMAYAITFIDFTLKSSSSFLMTQADMGGSWPSGSGTSANCIITITQYGSALTLNSGSTMWFMNSKTSKAFMWHVHSVVIQTRSSLMFENMTMICDRFCISIDGSLMVSDRSSLVISNSYATVPLGDEGEDLFFTRGPSSFSSNSEFLVLNNQLSPYRYAFHFYDSNCQLDNSVCSFTGNSVQGTPWRMTLAISNGGYAVAQCNNLAGAQLLRIDQYVTAGLNGLSSAFVCPQSGHCAHLNTSCIVAGTSTVNAGCDCVCNSIGLGPYCMPTIRPLYTSKCLETASPTFTAPESKTMSVSPFLSQATTATATVLSQSMKVTVTEQTVTRSMALSMSDTLSCKETSLTVSVSVRGTGSESTTRQRDTLSITQSYSGTASTSITQTQPQSGSVAPHSSASDSNTALGTFSQSVSLSSSLLRSESMELQPTPSDSNTTSTTHTRVASDTCLLSLSQTTKLTVSPRKWTPSQSDSTTRSGASLTHTRSPSHSTSTTATETRSVSASYSLNPCTMPWAASFFDLVGSMTSSVAVNFPHNVSTGVFAVDGLLSYNSLGNGASINITLTAPHRWRFSATGVPVPVTTVSSPVSVSAVVTGNNSLSLRLGAPTYNKFLAAKHISISIDSSSFYCAGRAASVSIGVVITPSPVVVSAAAVRAMTSVASSLSIVTANPTAGATAARISMLRNLLACTVELTENNGNSFTGYHFGPPRGQYSRGAVVGNVAFVIGVAAALFVVAASISTYQCLVRGTDFGWGVGVVLDVLHFPSVLTIPLAVVLQPTLTEAMSLMLHDPADGDRLLGVVGLAAMMLVVLPFTYVLVFDFRCTVEKRTEQNLAKRNAKVEASLVGWAVGGGGSGELIDAGSTAEPSEARFSAMRIIKAVFEEENHWVIADPTKTGKRWKRRFLFLFGDYSVRWYCIVELWISVTFGVIAGFNLGMRSVCMLQLLSVLVGYSVMFLCCAIRRPAFGWFGKVYFILVNGLGVMNAASTLVGFWASDDAAVNVSLVSALLTTSVSIAKALPDLLLIAVALPEVTASIGRLLSESDELHRRRRGLDTGHDEPLLGDELDDCIAAGKTPHCRDDECSSETVTTDSNSSVASSSSHSRNITVDVFFSGPTSAVPDVAQPADSATSPTSCTKFFTSDAESFLPASLLTTVELSVAQSASRSTRRGSWHRTLTVGCETQQGESSCESRKINSSNSFRSSSSVSEDVELYESEVSTSSRSSSSSELLL